MVADIEHEEYWTPLEQDTAAYFDSLPGDVQTEELRLGIALVTAAEEVDFDG